ncbi:MAG: hypothetical protein AABY16_01780 [Nanoarchaeota archaeon]
MEQIGKTMLTFGVLVFIIFGLYFFSDWFSKTTGYVLGEDEKLRLAQCLTSKDAVFYRSDTCPACDEQLELFGQDAIRFLNVFTCASVNECPEGGVPAWKINGQIYYGIDQFNELISVSECDLDQE